MLLNRIIFTLMNLMMWSRGWKQIDYHHRISHQSFCCWCRCCSCYHRHLNQEHSFSFFWDSDYQAWRSGRRHFSTSVCVQLVVSFSLDRFDMSIDLRLLSGDLGLTNRSLFFCVTLTKLTSDCSSLIPSSMCSYFHFEYVNTCWDAKIHEINCHFEIFHGNRNRAWNEQQSWSDSKIKSKDHLVVFEILTTIHGPPKTVGKLMPKPELTSENLRNKEIRIQKIEVGGTATGAVLVEPRKM